LGQALLSDRRMVLEDLGGDDAATRHLVAHDVRMVAA
jgi:hypothetical protein